MRLIMKAVILALIPVTIQAQTADEILANYFETTGGLDKWKSIKTMKMTGKVPSPQGDFNFVIYKKRSNLYKMEIDVQGTKLIPNAYDGKVAWTLNPFTGSTSAQKLPDEQAVAIKDQADFDDDFIDYKSKGHEVTLEGTQEIDGVECFKLKFIKNKNNDEEEVIEYHYFDSENFVPIMQQTYGRVGPQKGQELKTYLSDYQELDNGLIFPFYIETRTAGGQPAQQITIQSVEMDTEMSDDIFMFPEE